jgi:chromate transporter
MDPSRCPSLTQLFASFLRLGITSFGGPAMTAYIRRMAVEDKGWLDDKTFNQGVALCQAVPGATAMQVAAYVGLRARGVPGAAVTYIGFGLPAFLIMMLLSEIYLRTHTLPLVVALFSGFSAIVVAIIANAAATFGRSYLKLRRDMAIAAVAAIMYVLGISPLQVVILAILASLVVYRDRTFDFRPRSSEEVPRTIKPFILISAATALGVALLFFTRRDLFDMSTLMLRIDLFTFGGGFASIPLMLHEFVEVRSWMDGPTFMKGMALGQITPGPIVITATFVGYMLYGPVGGLVATLSILLPSFLIMIGTVPYYDRFSSSPRFYRAVNGALCSFVGLLASAAYHFALNVPWDAFHLAMAGAAFIALINKVEILWVVLAGAIISLILLW